MGSCSLLTKILEDFEFPGLSKLRTVLPIKT